MKKNNLPKPLTPEDKEWLLGGNIFDIDFLFDGNYAAKNPEIRGNWLVSEVKEWRQRTEQPINFITAMEAV